MPPPPPPPPPSGPGGLVINKTPAKKWPSVDVPPPPPSSSSPDDPPAFTASSAPKQQVSSPSSASTTAATSSGKKWATVETFASKGVPVNYDKKRQGTGNSGISTANKPAPPPPPPAPQISVPPPPPPPAAVAAPPPAPAPAAVPPPPPPPAPQEDAPAAKPGSLADQLKLKAKKLNNVPPPVEASPLPPAPSDPFLSGADEAPVPLTFESNLTIGRSTDALRSTNTLKDEKRAKKEQRDREVEEKRREADRQREQRIREKAEEASRRKSSRAATRTGTTAAGRLSLPWIIVFSVFGSILTLALLAVLMFFFFFKPAINVQIIRLESNVTGSASTVTSLKYLIRSINLCESVSVSSVGFTTSSNCLTLFDGTSSYDPNIFSLSNANARVATAQQDSWVDLASKASIDSVSNSIKITGIDAKKFSYVVVNWYRPVRVTGSVRVPNAGANAVATLVTKQVVSSATSDFHTSFTGGLYSEALSPLTNADLAAAIVPEEAIVPLATTAGIFRLQTPGFVSVNDVFFRNGYTVSLVVDSGSVNSLQGRVFGGTGNLMDKNGSSIFVAPILFAPIFHRPGDTIVAETYILNLPPNLGISLQLTLYLINSELIPSSSSLSILTTSNATVTLIPPQLDSFTIASTPGSTVATATSSLVFWDRLGNKVLDGFTRKTAIGDSDLVKLDCEVFEGWLRGSCPTGLVVSYTLVGVNQRQA
ncbi:hypothetical protein HDU97_007065 [Phlyctochytrium planicorne]|nr:hypothetical protein HDU97_007065 [Phlyctochytrium planicorne]